MKRNLDPGRINYLFKSWEWRQAKKIMTKIHDLNYFFWESTRRCNLDCLHCGSDCSKNEKSSELPAYKVIEVFKDISQNFDPKKIMIAVTGGEPLVREDLFEILSKISDFGFPWGMVTNGMLVNEEVVKKCKDLGMKTVSVSIDGNEESHNWLRNNSISYEKAVNALKLFSRQNDFKIVEAITCANERNIKHLDEVYENLKSIGIKKWRLVTIFPQGRAENNDIFKLRKNFLIELFSFIESKKQFDDQLHVTYSEEGYLGCDWEGKVRDELFYCGAGINVAGLLSDGSFSACPSLSRGWIQGHADELPFSEAWDKRYVNMRNRDWMKSSDCSVCKEWKSCRGSSLHLWDWQLNKPKLCHYRLINSLD